MCFSGFLTFPPGSQRIVFFSHLLFSSFFCFVLFFFFSAQAGGRMSCVLLDSSALQRDQEGSQVSIAYNSTHYCSLHGSILSTLHSRKLHKSYSTLGILEYFLPGQAFYLFCFFAFFLFSLFVCLIFLGRGQCFQCSWAFPSPLPLVQPGLINQILLVCLVVFSLVCNFCCCCQAQPFQAQSSWAFPPPFPPPPPPTTPVAQPGIVLPQCDPITATSSHLLANGEDKLIVKARVYQIARLQAR